MKKPYRIPDRSEDASALAENVAALVAANAATYAVAFDALEIAQEMLMTNSRPILVEYTQQSDSE